MEKKMVRKTRKETYFGSDVSDFIEGIKNTEAEIIKLGGTNISVNLGQAYYPYDNDPSPSLDFCYSILETDEEMQKRIDSENAWGEWRRKQFEQLQKEFGA
jgi:hypothetical protein